MEPSMNQIGTGKTRGSLKPSTEVLEAEYRTTTDPTTTRTELVCPICNKHYSQHSKFDRHVKGHEAKTHKCKQCPLSFASSQRLDSHLKSIHISAEELPFSCDLCPGPRRFAKLRSLEQHVVKIHVMDKEFKCKSCTKSFLTENDLSTHTRAKHPNKRPACDICSQTYVSVGQLKIHVYKVHDRRLCNMCLVICASLEELEDHLKTDREVDCLDNCCEFKFESQCLAQQHWNNFHSNSGVRTEAIEPVVKRQRLEPVVRRQRIEVIVRPKVPKEVQSTPPVVVQEKKEVVCVREQTEFPCDHCWDIFKTEHELKTHAELSHAAITWECDACSESFKTLEELDSHREAGIHRIVEKVIVRSRKLRKARGEGEPKRCHVCSQLCTSSVQLKRHLDKHLDTGAEDPSEPLREVFKCRYCTSVFSTTRGLQCHTSIMHNKKERLLKCPDCPAAFFRRQNLLNHITTHSVDRPFPCETCFLKFKSRRRLLDHLRRKRCKLVREVQPESNNAQVQT